MSALASLKLVAAKRPTKVSDVVMRRTKIVKRLAEQIEIAKLKQGQSGSAPTKLRIVTDPVTGEKRTTQVQKRVREWFFASDSGKLCVGLRYGNRNVEFAKGRTAVEVASADDLIPTLVTLRDAVLNGELDAQLEAVSNQVKAAFKK